jgi:hypothetical protein
VIQTKPKKTERELQALIMKEVRKYPEFSNILSVAITRPVQLASHHPNWAFAWTVNGSAPASYKADEIPGKLQKEYDLT